MSTRAQLRRAAAKHRRQHDWFRRLKTYGPAEKNMQEWQQKTERSRSAPAKPLKCPYCSFKTLQRSELVLHVSRKHSKAIDALLQRSSRRVRRVAQMKIDSLRGNSDYIIFPKNQTDSVPLNRANACLNPGEQRTEQDQTQDNGVSCAAQKATPHCLTPETCADPLPGIQPRHCSPSGSPDSLAQPQS